jgi:saccharopine dehydrogenase-like NADP-dependent oxidoreductase
MKKILVIGAGRSSSVLIDYLIENAADEDWFVTVADANIELAESKTQESERAKAFHFDANDAEMRTNLIYSHDLIISMLPANMHFEIAKVCLSNKKNLITPSYVSKEMRAMDVEIKNAGLLFLNEMGVDPGIDHMSAMKIIDKVKREGGEVLSFDSFCGGLIAPENDNNPWNYKFTWNPRNVVLAGQGGQAKYLHNGQLKYIPYNKLFKRTDTLEIAGFGKFEAYANRDSISYKDVYGLANIKSIYRGTLRRPGFCRAWDVFAQLGATDDTLIIENSEALTNRQFINSFMAYDKILPVEMKIKNYCGLQNDQATMDKLTWLGIFENKKIDLKNATAAQILQKILEEKLVLQENDKDMLVMHHHFVYSLLNEVREIKSSMVVLGEDKINTAMAKTVGLPIGIAAKLLLRGEINLKGVHLPVDEQIYKPILNELALYGINFTEKEYETKGY